MRSTNKIVKYDAPLKIQQSEKQSSLLLSNFRDESLLEGLCRSWRSNKG